ncbi:nucleoid-associated protein [soil metagenome]
MGLTLNFKDAQLTSLSLAKVGNPSRDEPVQTSKSLCRFEATEAELLTTCFLKPFRTLEQFRFRHPDDVRKNEVFGYAAAIFDAPDSLLQNGARIAKYLHAKSNHPNIKAGDLCVALIDGVKAGGETCRVLSIIKSESKVPFLQVSVAAGGDLQLTTQQGIYPDKIDKGCLIVDTWRDQGFAVYKFDKTSTETQFWNREFLNVEAMRDDDYLTRRYSDLCVKFAESGLPDEARADERMAMADRAMGHLAAATSFDRATFEAEVLEEPDLIEKFGHFKADYETTNDVDPLDDTFTVSTDVAERARKKLKGKMRLDTGADIRFSRTFIDQADAFLEKGFDEAKHMQFVKIYFNRER